MAAPEDAGLIKQLLEWAWAGVLLLGGIIFRGVKEDITKKADKEHVEALQRDIVERRVVEAKLFDKIDEMGSETVVKFTTLERISTDRHLELLKAIHEVKK